jgi:hypothetical protein
MMAEEKNLLLVALLALVRILLDLSEWFKWDDWNQSADGAIQLVDCILLREISPTLKKGDKIDFIDVDFNSGRMQFWKSKDIDGEHNETINVGNFRIDIRIAEELKLEKPERN